MDFQLIFHNDLMMDVYISFLFTVKDDEEIVNIDGIHGNAAVVDIKPVSAVDRIASQLTKIEGCQVTARNVSLDLQMSLKCLVLLF